jgi:transposase
MSHVNSTALVDPRAQRGERIASRYNLKPNGSVWSVPSESSNDRYKVDPEAGRCTCPDNEVRRVKCKHLWAVEITKQRETVKTVETTQNADGSTSTTVKKVTKTVKTARVTYKQEWTAYNAAQTNEKDWFLSLLHELCQTIQEPAQTMGRPRLPLADMVFCAAFKMYTRLSGRRFMCDLRDAHERGYISSAPHYNSIFNYLEMESLTTTLRDLITASSLPLRAVESDFALDSTGFGTTGSVTWYSKKYEHDVDNADWIKVHLMCGVTTNVVTSVEISGRDDHDSKYLPALVNTTAKNFTMKEVSADKAYSGVAALDIIEGHGAVPYIPFKSNTTGKGNTPLWRKMWAYYNFQRDEFLEHYHKRSNIETVNSMIKGKFGGKLWSKTETGQINEALIKVLCHNICVLVQSIYELDIAPVFWKDGSAALPA